MSEFVAEWQHRTVNRSDPRLIRQFTEHSGEMLDWLFTLMDPSHREMAKGYAYSKPEDCYNDADGYKSWLGTCSIFTFKKGVRELIANCEAHGAVWQWDSRARLLTQDETGRVTGVITESRDGVFKKHLARKGVILTAGDWGANHDMFVHLYSEIVQQYEAYGLDTGKLRTALGRNGDGQKLAVWAGGSMEPGPYASVYPTAFPPAMADDKLMGWGGGMRGTSFAENVVNFIARQLLQHPAVILVESAIARKSVSEGIPSSVKVVGRPISRIKSASASIPARAVSSSLPFGAMPQTFCAQRANRAAPDL